MVAVFPLMKITKRSKSFSSTKIKVKHNPNKAGPFEGSFFWRGGANLPPSPFIFQGRNNLISIYTIVEQSI